MRWIATLLVLFAGAGVAQAQSSTALAMEMGRMLAFETRCDLAYSPEAITAFVRDNVDPSDVRFNSTMTTSLTYQANELDDMSSSAIVMQCAQIEQTAREFGFIE